MNSKILPSIDTSWTLFLDRDGVINRRIVGDYVRSVEQFEILEGVEEAIQIFDAIFSLILVVTNQQGIGKGLMTIQDVQLIHQYLQERLSTRDSQIDSFYVAPQLAAEHSVMRKPGNGMALQAKSDFPDINFEKSIMVGDSLTDMQFGKSVGMYTIFIGESAAETIDICLPTLWDVAKFIENLS